MEEKSLGAQLQETRDLINKYRQLLMYKKKGYSEQSSFICEFDNTEIINWQYKQISSYLNRKFFNVEEKLKAYNLISNDDIKEEYHKKLMNEIINTLVELVSAIDEELPREIAIDKIEADIRAGSFSESYIDILMKSSPRTVARELYEIRERQKEKSTSEER